MTLVRNSELLLELRRAAQIAQATEPTPNILGDRIIPTIEVNPRFARYCTIIKSLDGAGTIYTAPAENTGQRFILVAIDASYTKVAGDTGIEFSIKGTAKGQANGNIMTFKGVTLTAAQEHGDLSLNPGIDIEPGSAVSIALNGTYTLASARIIGILVTNALG